MQKKPKKFRLTPKKIILVLLALFIVVGIIWHQVHSHVNRPQNIGHSLEYIGTHSYGCIWLCDSNPSATHYFATDMNEEEIKDYFKGAVYIDGQSGSGAGYHYKWLQYSYSTTESSVKDFRITYYNSEDAQKVVNIFHLGTLTKKNLIDIADFNYKEVQAAYKNQ